MLTIFKEKKQALQQLPYSIPWQSFRPLLDKDYAQELRRNAGRKRINPLILFKTLMLQQRFNLSVGLAFRLRLKNLSSGISPATGRRGTQGGRVPLRGVKPEARIP